MKRILILPNAYKDEGYAVSRRIVSYLTEQGAEVYAKDGDLPSLSSVGARALAELSGALELIVSVGGDGTVLASAGEALRYGAPLLGVNMGRLGFLAELDAEEIDRLSRLFKKARVRALLDGCDAILLRAPDLLLQLTARGRLPLLHLAAQAVGTCEALRAAGRAERADELAHELLARGEARINTAAVNDYYGVGAPAYPPFGYDVERAHLLQGYIMVAFAKLALGNTAEADEYIARVAEIDSADFHIHLYEAIKNG